MIYLIAGIIVIGVVIIEAVMIIDLLLLSKKLKEKRKICKVLLEEWIEQKMHKS